MLWLTAAIVLAANFLVWPDSLGNWAAAQTDAALLAVRRYHGRRPRGPAVARGLQRLQIETLADNHAMLSSAERNGFVREGVLRSSAWVLGEFLDTVGARSCRFT